MITLSNGYELEFVAASGALNFDGKGYWWEKPLKLLGLFDASLFTPVTKTLTYLPDKGNGRYPWYNVRFIKDGVLNAMGVPNPGINEWAKNNKSFKGIVSIYPDNNDYNLRQILNILNKMNRYNDNGGEGEIEAIELNVSCHNRIVNDYIFDFEGYQIEWIVKEAKKNTDIPIILKLAVTNRIENIFPGIEKYIEAISINSVPWDYIFPCKGNPFEEYGLGSVSGKIAQPYTWAFIDKLVGMTKTPIIGCSIWDYEDIEKLKEKKCKAFSFGSVFLKYPWRPTQFVRRYTRQ